MRREFVILRQENSGELILSLKQQEVGMNVGVALASWDIIMHTSVRTTRALHPCSTTPPLITTPHN